MVFKKKETELGGIDPAETVTEKPAPVLDDTKTAPIAEIPRETFGANAPPIMDARARMMTSLKEAAERGVLVVDQFNELKTEMPSKAPPRWPATIAGKKVIGKYKFCGKNGEGLAGNDEVGYVWTPLSREFCAAHEELKHITTGFNAEGLYQCDDSIFGYYDEETLRRYDEARSYNKPQQITLRKMQDNFARARRHEEQMPGTSRMSDPDAVLLTQFSTGMIDESIALQLAQRGRPKSAAA